MCELQGELWRRPLREAAMQQQTAHINSRKSLVFTLFFQSCNSGFKVLLPLNNH